MLREIRGRIQESPLREHVQLPKFLAMGPKSH
jgi:hypothetical protein